ncbi:unnamed protein product [Rotaria socialis]|uniref:Mitochondrial inner membrane protease ATP23 n=1 Tax=Rotaria socialis TaxID=392032 RepID=A0A819V5G8_9BILA|nr:unnamed protein product [Rotaria socialis]CAF3343965.1 unnamed protein product [Rotaria socialis]CAF3352290.1 unnamed protein product [Rotaria socialis]CAF3364720.1 unnamed protein product [Rotaria socialis]CAF3529334.1 unnamed protein product [Rotaria socialis]
MVFEKFFQKQKKTESASLPSTETKTDVKTDNDNNENRYINALKDCKPTALEDYGYYFFPERFGKERVLTISQRALQLSIPLDSASRDLTRKIECEKYIIKSIESNPLIKTLVQALADHNCPIDLSRHFSCEQCDDAMPTGMFDPATNQIVVCKNHISHFDDCIITGLVQAFDYCRNKYDVHNLHHFACSQIRALNFTDCSLMKGCYVDLRVKRRYHACLEKEAVQRLRMMRSVEEKEAKQIVKDVFRPCRYDLEPFGEDPKLIPKNKYIYNDYERYRRWSKATA